MINRKALGGFVASLIILGGCGEAQPTDIPVQPTVAAVTVVLTPTIATSAVDFSDPVSVVEAIFTAARQQDFDQLADLCDPQKQNDGDTQSICDLATATDLRESFVEAFAKGKVAGSPTLGSEGGDEIAEVPFAFGPDGSQTETMKLVKREGRWYLMSF